MSVSRPLKEEPHVFVRLIFTSPLDMATKLVFKFNFVIFIEMLAEANRPALVFRKKDPHEFIIGRRIVGADACFQARPELLERAAYNCLGVAVILFKIDTRNDAFLA